MAMSYGPTPASLTPASSNDNSNASPAPSPPLDHSVVTPAATELVRRTSSDGSSGQRVLVPQGTQDSSVSARDFNTVSAPHDVGPSSCSGGGPTGKTYTIPPRPKPGRKPATDEPASKRKAQNRESQRAFRRRKQQTYEDMKAQAETTERNHQIELNAKLREIDHLTKKAQELQQENKVLIRERDYWKEHYQQLSENITPAAIPPQHNPFNQHSLFQLNPLADARHDSPNRTSAGSAHAYNTPSTTGPLGCDRCEPDNCACMAEIANDMTFENTLAPMDAVPLPSRSNRLDPMTGIERTGQATSPDDFQDREIDFTASFQAQRAPATLMPSSEMVKVQDCGWCTNTPEICLCKDQSVRPVGDDVMAPSSEVTSNSSMDDVKPAPVMSGPGTCAGCQADPRQRAWCQRVAQSQGEATPPSSRRNSNRSNTPNILEPPVGTLIDKNMARSSPFTGERSIGCSDAFRLLDGRVSMDVDRMDWRRLKPVPASIPKSPLRNTFTMEPGTFSAMELDASSILTTLQHSRGPLKPRPTDGRLAPLIREAEDLRRATISPMASP